MTWIPVRLVNLWKIRIKPPGVKRVPSSVWNSAPSRSASVFLYANNARLVVTPITALRSFFPLPCLTFTSPLCISISVQLRRITSDRLNPLSTMKRITALSRTLQAVTIWRSCSTVRTGNRFFSSFGISKVIGWGMYPSSCQNLRSVRIARA